MLLYIVRHGDPDYTTDSLTPRGVLQAESAAKRLAQAGIDRIFTSPMGRARQTAEPLCHLLNKEYTVEDWSHEINARIQLPNGEERQLHAVANTTFRANGLWQLSGENAVNHPVFDGTAVADEVHRIEREGNAFLERLGYKEEDGNYRILQPSDENIALFCHGNFARVWLSSLLKLPLHMMLASFGYNHTGVTILEFRNSSSGLTAPRCLVYADCSHLYAHGPDMKYIGTFEV